MNDHFVSGDGYTAILRDDGTLITDGDSNKAIGEYNKKYGTNYGWTKPAEGETDLSSKGRKVRNADVVQNPDGSYGIGKEYNKNQSNNQTSKVVQPNINNTNQAPDSNLNMILGFTIFFTVIIATIAIRLWRKNGNLNKRFWPKRNSKNILESSIKNKRVCKNKIDNTTGELKRMSKFDLNLIDIHDRFLMARMLREEDGRTNEPRLSRIGYFFTKVGLIILVNIIFSVYINGQNSNGISGYENSDYFFVVTGFVSFLWIIGNLSIISCRLNDIGLTKKIRNRIITTVGLIELFFVAFGISSGGSSSGSGSVSIILVYIGLVGSFLNLYLLLEPTDQGYTGRMFRGFYNDSELSFIYQQIIDGREENKESKKENYYKNDIREIKKLYDEGILTEEEFKKAKKKILDI